ncbi:hypothetical protein OEZ86_007861 [Tetradesmus obliquus]|nr:hypothetical protein OEZ86_007861 [Tetradesmus obliquus]
MGCESDDLTEQHKQFIRDLSSSALQVEYRTVPDIKIKNDFSPRFGLNWIKLNSWNMTEFDTVINLDTDMTVLGDLTHLRSLPTDFAWVPWQGPYKWWHNKGGFVFLRPCRAVAEHMVQLVTSEERLQFPDLHAEQTFISWYFHYTGFRLPMIYNTNSIKGIDKIEGDKLLTIGGAPPIVLHFANTKPWNIKKDDKMWPFANRCKDDLEQPGKPEAPQQQQQQQQRKPFAQAEGDVKRNATVHKRPGLLAMLGR